MGRRKKSKSRTLAVVIQDRSGSMSNRIDATISGYNEYVDTLRQDPDSEVLLTLVQFDEHVKTVYTSIPLDEVPKLDRKSYALGGMTALLDAVGETVRAVERTAKPNDRVLVTIMTDGGENSSKKYTRGAIMDLFRKKREHEWEFVFLGAGEESWNAGLSLGFERSHTLFYGNDAHAHEGAFESLGALGSSYSRGVGVAQNASFLATKCSTEAASGADRLWTPDAEDAETTTKAKAAKEGSKLEPSGA